MPSVRASTTGFVLAAVFLLLFAAIAPATGGASTVGASADASDPSANASAGSQSVATGSTGGEARSATATRTISMHQRLRLTPAVPGEIGVTQRYALPSGVTQLTTRLPPRATVTEANGFVSRGDNEFAWDRRTSDPSLSYRLPANETRQTTGPIAGSGKYVFVDAGEWALVRVPQGATSWSWTGGGTVGLSRDVAVEGAGTAGEAIAFLGEHRVEQRTAHGQTFRLVVPDRARLAEPPSAILDSLASASNALRVGDRDERVFVVAAPTGSVEWDVRGLQTGAADAWVRDAERLDSANNVWLHEYVHTRQRYAASGEVQWFTEASATYYGALLAMEQGRVDFDAFRRRMALGERTPDADAVLADPATWDGVAPYTKGALVAGELDRRTRLASDRSRSLQSVFAGMNAREDAVNATAFRALVRDAADEETARLATRYTTTREGPTTWDAAAHDRAFSRTPARIGYALPATTGDQGYRVSGPYRDGAVGPERPVRLATGETLGFDVRVTNTGGTAGAYDARVLVNGEARTRLSGTVAPGETRTHHVSLAFPEPGEFAVAVGGASVPVSVRRPGTPTVTALAATPTRAGPNGTGSVSVTAAVRNDAGYPAASNLTLYRDGRAAETRTVRLGPGESGTVAFAAQSLPPGSYAFRVGDRTASVTVRSGSDRATAADGRGGFGLLPALLALLAVLVAVRRRR